MSKTRFFTLVFLVSLVSCFFIAGTSSAALTAADCETCHVRTYLSPGVNLFPKIEHHNLGTANGLACTYCHRKANPTCLDCHNNPLIDTNGYHLSAHTRISIATDCQACHASAQIIETTHLNNCFGCHANSDPVRAAEVKPVIDSGIAGNPVDCNDCHDAHDFGLIHDISETAGCVDCHDVLNGGKTGIEAVHNTPRNGAGSCATCHNSTDATTRGFIDDEVANVLTCSSCHAPHDFSSNHDITESGGCASCHEALNGEQSGIEAVHATATNGAGSCNTCHNSTTGTYAGTQFDIYINNNAADALDCNSCHIPHSFADNHIISETAGCIDCHDQLNGTEAGIETVHNTATNGAGSCATCHDSTTATYAGSQFDLYVHNNQADTLTCASCHMAHVFNDIHSITEFPARCTNCHDQLDTTLSGIDAEHDNGEGSAGSCDTCHNSSRTDVQAFIDARAAVNCDDCHTNIVDAAHTTNHDKTVVPDAGCLECHVANVANEHVGRTHSGDGHVITCEGCHVGDSASVGFIQKGINGIEVSCVDCHLFPVTSSGHLDAHEVTVAPACSACHTGLDTMAAIDAVHNVPTNGDSSCSTCHSSSRTDVMTAIAAKAAVNCTACHGDHVFADDHTIAETAGCVSCHTELDGSIASVKTVHKDDCTTCHGPDVRADVKTIIANKSAVDCSSCHDAHSFDIDHTIAETAGCVDCHTVLDNTIASVKAVHKDDCTTCHGPDVRAEVKTIVANKSAVDCSSCHDAHVFNDIHSITEFPVRCRNCHDELVTGLSGIDVAHDNGEGAAGSCDTCHNSSRADVQAFIDAKAPVNCDTCHTDIVDTTHTTNHDKTIVPDSGCLECHVKNVANEHVGRISSATDQHVIVCEGCHADSNFDGIIASGIAGNDVSCVECHFFVATPADHLDAHKVTVAPACSACHTGLDTMAAIDAVHNVPTNGASSCSTCHSSTRTDVMAAIAGKAVVTCTACHGDHVFADIHDITETGGCASCHEALNGDKSGIEAVHNTATNGAGSCATCHNSATSTYAGSQFDSYINNNAADALECNSCHLPHSFADNHIISETAGCIDCHDQLNGTEAGIETVHNTATNGAGSCATCHDSTIATYAGQQFDIYINNNQADTLTCASCHMAHTPTHSNIVSIDPCWACHGQNNTDVVSVHLNDCLKCHTSVDLIVEQAIAAGSANCSTCHVEVDIYNGTRAHILQHNMTDAPDPACLDCHEQNVALGHVINRGSGCGACHNDGAYAAPIAKGRGENGQTVTCDDCHFPNVTFASHTEQHDTTTLPETSCGECHSANIAFEHVTNRNLECVVCHKNPNSVRAAQLAPVIAAGIFGTAVNCSDCHTGPFDHTSVHDMTALPSQECTGCHDPNVVIEHVLDRGLSCSVCHDNSAYDSIIQSGINDSTVYCTDCHTGVLDHSASHADTNVPEPICENCHDPNVFEEHVTVRGRDCSICHNSTYQGVIDQGVANTITVTCTSCHLTPDHHNNDTAKTGMCHVCHIDPRPLVNDPKQLACRQCHVDSQGYVKTSAPSPSHKFNTDPSLSVRKIDDFGACFACHAPIPYHAKPTSDPLCWTLPSNSPYYIPDQAPGFGTFNFFKSEYRQPRKYYDNSSYERRAKDWCKDLDDQYNNPQINFYWFDIVYQGQAESVPAFDPAQPFPPYPHSRIKAIGNCGDCHTVGTVVSVTHNNDCQGCHFSPVKSVQNVINWGRAGNDVNCYSCHGEGGHTAQHDKTVLTQPSCSECHVANVVTEHVDNRGLACSVCHSSTDTKVVNAITKGKNGFDVTCFDCHGTADHASLHDTDVDEPGCADCHNPNVVTEHLVNRGLDCTNCHDSADPNVTAAIAGNYSPKLCSDCHGPTDHPSAHDNAGPAGGSNCTDCHAANVVTEHITSQNLTCGTCHDNPLYSTLITNGKSGKPADYVTCEDCHGPDAGDHAAAHNNAGVPSPGCTDCHKANVVEEHVYDRGYTCGTCHDNPSYATQINNGKNGILVSCYDCHGTNTHHDKTEAMTGDCTFCHADPRLDIDPDAPAGQLACRQCHIDNNGFVKTSVPSPDHAYNTQGNIQDFGACFDCHQPMPYHAKPITYQDCWRTIPSVSQYYDSTLAPGKGTFNLFRSEFQRPEEYYDGTPYKDLGKNTCRDYRSDWNSPRISFNWMTFTDIFGTNQQWTVPTFGTGSGGGPGGGNDTVNITYANYSSRRDMLYVYAESSMGDNVMLTVHYYGSIYEMYWDNSDNRHEITISTSSCRDSTIEVTSSGGGSDSSSVSNCSSH